MLATEIRTRPAPCADLDLRVRYPSPTFDNKLVYLIRDWQISGTTTLRDGLAVPDSYFDADATESVTSHTYFNCVAPIPYQLHDFTHALRVP